jgi:hypothetical protein
VESDLTFSLSVAIISISWLKNHAADAFLVVGIRFAFLDYAAGTAPVIALPAFTSFPLVRMCSINADPITKPRPPQYFTCSPRRRASRIAALPRPVNRMTSGSVVGFSSESEHFLRIMQSVAGRGRWRKCGPGCQSVPGAKELARAWGDAQ